MGSVLDASARCFPTAGTSTNLCSRNLKFSPWFQGVLSIYLSSCAFVLL